MNKLCKYPGCLNLETKNGYCEIHQIIGNKIEMQNKINKEKYNQKKLNGMHSNIQYRQNDIYRRSPIWQNIRKIILSKQKECQKCGSSENLEIHHVVPPKGDRDLFYNFSNLIVLCSNCHSKITAYQNGVGGIKIKKLKF